MLQINSFCCLLLLGVGWGVAILPIKNFSAVKVPLYFVDCQEKSSPDFWLCLNFALFVVKSNQFWNVINFQNVEKTSFKHIKKCGIFSWCIFWMLINLHSNTISYSTWHSCSSYFLRTVLALYAVCMFMSIEGSAKFIYVYRLVLVTRIEVYQIWGIFMGIECASSTLIFPVLPNLANMLISGLPYNFQNIICDLQVQLFF